MKKTLRVVLALYLVVSFFPIALVQAVDESNAIDDSLSVYDNAREYGQQLGESVFDKLMKRDGAEPFRFLDKFTWGMSVDEVTSAANSLGMNRLTDLELAQDIADTVGYFELSYSAYSIYQWSAHDVVYTFHVHPRMGLFDIMVYLSYKEDDQNRLATDNLMESFHKVKLEIMYEAGIPLIDYSDDEEPSVYWLLDDFTVLKCYFLKGDEFFDDMIFVVYKSPESDEVHQIIEYEQNTNGF